jgi:catechol 2,3-dioxygenase-like lactoylglutathione lyase family enzyme
MIDHTGVIVSDYAKSKEFYTRTLAPLGYVLIKEIPASVTGHTDVAGFGEPSKPDFWISGATPDKPVQRPASHIAFRARNRAMVDAFHKTALTAGGKDNGQPGVRAHYHPDYYSAFVLDPDGHNIEAVCHEPA